MQCIKGNQVWDYSVQLQRYLERDFVNLNVILSGDEDLNIRQETN